MSERCKHGKAPENPCWECDEERGEQPSSFAAAHGSAASWQPIETAPKDGTPLLLFYPDYRRKIWIGHYYSTERYDHGKLKSKSEGWHYGADTIGLVKECAPTHWMALPLPPNGDIRQAGPDA